MIQMLVCDKLSMNLFFTNSLRHTAHLAFPSVLAVNVWSPALPFGATGLCQQSLHFQHAFIWCTKISSQITFCQCLSKSHIWQGFMCAKSCIHTIHISQLLFLFKQGLLVFLIIRTCQYIITVSHQRTEMTPKAMYMHFLGLHIVWCIHVFCLVCTWFMFVPTFDEVCSCVLWGALTYQLQARLLWFAQLATAVQQAKFLVVVYPCQDCCWPRVDNGCCGWLLLLQQAGVLFCVPL